MAFLALLLLPFVLAILYVCSTIILPPRTLPRNIPTIPFYLTLLPLIKKTDQSILFRRYLQAPLTTYGAVKIYFSTRWCILVTHPRLVAEIFKHEDVYAKAGNHVKIPGSVLAEYTGENIISAHGVVWKGFQGVIKPGLQRRFDDDAERMWRNAGRLIELLMEKQAEVGTGGGGVLIPGLVQRFVVDTLGAVVLRTEFDVSSHFAFSMKAEKSDDRMTEKTLDSADAPMHAMQLALKPHIFHPIFLSFPILDRFPALFPSRRRARKLVHEFTSHLISTFESNHVCAKLGPQSDCLGCRILAARRDGTLTEQQFRHNLVAIFVAGHENPMLAVISTLFLLGRNQNIQQRLREEIQSLGTDEPSLAQLATLPLLTSVIYESLRLFPPHLATHQPPHIPRCPPKRHHPHPERNLRRLPRVRDEPLHGSVGCRRG